jgi:hypothetical protein
LQCWDGGGGPDALMVSRDGLKVCRIVLSLAT